jgi:ArsR family transcriptional regulator, lead/cadmium/zinc/bismuth-responsive transcriptional repressor
LLLENAVARPRFVNPEGVQLSRKAIPDADMILGLSEIFKVLGDATRLRILIALTRSELCVSDLASLLALTESAVSHQLRLMKSMRLVRHRRSGKLAYYMLDDEHVEDLIRMGVRHVGEV